MQALQVACARAGPRADGSGNADLDTPGGREALDTLCAEWRGRSPEARGAILNAYRRWAKGDIRRMRAPATTAAAAGGS